MPIYRYRDKKTGKQVDVIRSFAEFEQPPTAEEGTRAGVELTGDEDWERVLSGFQLVKSDVWGGGKGNW